MQELPLALLEDLLLQLGRAPWPLKIALHWGDEPLANPRFDQVLELCRRRLPRATWLLQINGDALTAERLRELRGFFAAIAINLYDARAARRLRALGLDDDDERVPRRHRHPGQIVRGPPSRADGAGVVVVNHKYRDRGWIERPVAPGAQTGLCTHLWHDAAVGHDGRLYLCCRDSLRQHPVGDRRQALLAYPAWRALHVDGASAPRPFLMPPSGRFHVEVPVGRAPAARLLWVNQPALRELGLELSRAQLDHLCGLATLAPTPAHTLVATRYQDSPGTGEGQAQGDGARSRASDLNLLLLARGLDDDARAGCAQRWRRALDALWVPFARGGRAPYPELAVVDAATLREAWSALDASLPPRRRVHPAQVVIWALPDEDPAIR